MTDLLNTYFADIEVFVNSKLMPQLNSLIMTISMSVVSILKEFWNLIIGFIISIYILSSKEVFAAQAKRWYMPFCQRRQQTGLSVMYGLQTRHSADFSWEKLWILSL